jgi:hypothetical protein
MQTSSYLWRGESNSTIMLKCFIITLLAASPSAIRRGRPPLACLHALWLPSDTKTGVQSCGLRGKASSLSPHMHVPFMAAGSKVQAVRQPPPRSDTVPSASTTQLPSTLPPDLLPLSTWQTCPPGPWYCCTQLNIEKIFCHEIDHIGYFRITILCWFQKCYLAKWKMQAILASRKAMTQSFDPA